jgi:hypothetical protein
MRFVSIYKLSPDRFAAPASEAEMTAMGRLIGEMQAAGVLIDTGGTAPTDVSLRVRRAGSQTTVTDGPFTESKEVIGGYAVLDVQSKDEAILWTRRFLDCAGDGVVELMEVTSGP